MGWVHLADARSWGLGADACSSERLTQGRGIVRSRLDNCGEKVKSGKRQGTGTWDLEVLAGIRFRLCL